MTELRVELPDEVVEAIAQRAAEIVLAWLDQRRDPEPEFLTVPQACARYGWSRQRIYDLRSSGRLSRIGDGASVRVSRAEADALIQNGGGR